MKCMKLETRIRLKLSKLLVEKGLSCDKPQTSTEMIMDYVKLGLENPYKRIGKVLAEALLEHDQQVKAQELRANKADKLKEGLHEIVASEFNSKTT